MQNVRRDDLHYDREADFFCHLDSFFNIVRQSGGGDGQTIGFEDVLGFNFGQSVATLGTGTGDDLAGFCTIHIAGFVHAVVSSLQQFVLFTQGCQGFNCQVGGIVSWNAVFDQPLGRFFTAFAADKGDCEGFAGYTGFFLSVVNGFCNFLRFSDGGFTIEHNHAIHPGVCIGIFDAFIITFQTSPAGDIYRVLGGTEGGHVLAQFNLNIFRGELEGQAVFFSCISCQNANTTAIGDDQEVITFHDRLQ